MSVPTASVDALPNSAFTFLSKLEYFHDLVERIVATKKGDRILVTTMSFDVREPEIRKLMKALCSAASRGVATSLVIDARALPVIQKVPITRAAHAFLRTTRDALEELKAHGGAYAITNKTYRRVMNPFAGRSHIKVGIVNDEVYVGSSNLGDITYTEMIVRWQDTRAADWLYTCMSEVVHQQSTKIALDGKDRELFLDKNTRLLLDGGKPKQSLIYEHALSLIDTAEKWIVMTCQYFPNSITAKHLAAAHKRGVNVSLYYNHPSQHPTGHNLLHHTVLLQERSRRPSALFKEQLHKDLPYMHAKLIATDKGAIIGSHNYVLAGVNLGTAELAILRYDTEFARQAVKHFLQQID